MQVSIEQQQLHLPGRQQVKQLWLEQLCKDNLGWNNSELDALAMLALKDFYCFLDDDLETKEFDLQKFVQTYLHTEYPSIADVSHIFIMLRSAFRKLMDRQSQAGNLDILEQLDVWTQLIVSNYTIIYSKLVQARDAMIAEHVSGLTMLTRCASLLNTSLDTVSVVNLAAQLGRDLTNADLCIVFRRDGDSLIPSAHSGTVEYINRPIRVTSSTLLKELIIDEVRQDIPLQTICENLGIPGIRAVTSSPLQAGNNTIGKLVAVYLKPQQFTTRQIRLHEIFASHAGQALHNAQLYEQLGCMVAAQERQRLAMEMHDTMLQTMTSLNINLRVALSYIDDAEWDNAAGCVRTAQMLGKEALEEGRETLKNLTKGCTSDEETLIDVIQSEMKLFEEQSGIAPQLTKPSTTLSVFGDVKHHLRRLIGECLNNIYRHANATEVKICIREELGELCLSIQDNGQGFMPSKVNEQLSFGLSGMRERSRLINARFEVQSTPGTGTTVNIRIPCKYSK